MKKIIEVVETDGGFEDFLGQEVLVFALNYIYAGKLTGVNKTCIELSGAKIVYETGPFNLAGYKDAQTLPGTTLLIQTAAIESLGAGK